MKISRSNLPRTYALRDKVLESLQQVETQKMYQDALKDAFKAMLKLCSELESELKPRQRVTPLGKRQFEAWAMAQKPPLEVDRENGRYISWNTELAYQAWSAATRSVRRVSRLPKSR